MSDDDRFGSMRSGSGFPTRILENRAASAESRRDGLCGRIPGRGATHEAQSGVMRHPDGKSRLQGVAFCLHKVRRRTQLVSPDSEAYRIMRTESFQACLVGK